MTRDPRLYLPFEGSHTQDFYPLKKLIRPRPGLNPRIRDPVASTITTGPPEERGTFAVNRADCGVPMRRRTANIEEDTLHRVEQTPSGSFCMSSKYSTQLIITKGYMQWFLPILHCVNFCMRFLHRCVEEPQFPRQILFTDECRFTVLNSRVSHVWMTKTLHAQHAHGSQQRFGINVCTGIVDGRLIGAYLLPPSLPATLIFLQEVLGELSKEV